MATLACTVWCLPLGEVERAASFPWFFFRPVRSVAPAAARPVQRERRDVRGVAAPRSGGAPAGRRRRRLTLFPPPFFFCCFFLRCDPHPWLARGPPPRRGDGRRDWPPPLVRLASGRARGAWRRAWRRAGRPPERQWQRGRRRQSPMPNLVPRAGIAPIGGACEGRGPPGRRAARCQALSECPPSRVVASPLGDRGLGQNAATAARLVS